MRVEIHVVNAFIDGDAGGNPAGVMLDADRFNKEQKRLIAAQVGLSETAFVSRSASADFKLEFFTPTRQIAHCGHATIATFSYLQQTGKIGKAKSSKETIDGNREIHIEGEMAFMQQRAPRYTDLDQATLDAALASVRLARDDLLDGCEPVVVNTGNNFLIVPLKNEAAVRRADPQLAAITALSEQLDLIGYYLFSPDTQVADRDAGTRMFAPRYGITEEAATGMAAGPLACFLHDRLQRTKALMLIEQGRLMSPPSPSLIQVQLEITDGRIQGLRAGGKAKLVKSIKLEI